MSRSASVGFISDPKLLPRIRNVKEYKPTLDAEEVATELQSKFPEYSRKKYRDLVRTVKLGLSRLDITEKKPAVLRNSEVQNISYDESINNSTVGIHGNRKRRLSNSKSEPIFTIEDDSNANDPAFPAYVSYQDTNSANKSLKKLYNSGAKGRKRSLFGSNHQHMNKQQNERTERDGLSGLTNGTKIFLNVHPEKATVKFSDLGGCERQCLDVCRLSIHLKHPEVHKQLGVTPPRGILLHGPPGCGKTLFAEAVAGELDVPLLRVASTELIAGITGESEEKIRSLFSLAVANAPCVLLLDEIDAIAPKRESTSREMEKRVVSQLISCLDELCKSSVKNEDVRTEAGDLEMLSEESSLPPQHVLVIGTTSRVDSIETALRRAGRFDKEVALGIPDEKARLAILRIVCRGIRLDENIHMEEIAKLTPGYVGADLKALAREAALCSVNRLLGTVAGSGVNKATEGGEVTSELEKLLAWLKNDSSVEQGQISGLCVTTSDFEKALSMVHPSAKREGFATVPNVSWKDIGALKAVREELLWSILYPIKRPEEFELLGLKNRPQGLLLCGPPGCGKTLLAKAVANESGMNFISVKGPELLSMYVGESERAVRVVFQRARDSSPCVIFFDEIDALCPKRSGHETSGSARLVNQLLTEMDGMDSRKQVFLIGATNRPDIVDPAILRPGRLDKILFVDFPNLSDKVDILEKLTANRTHPCIASDVSFAEIASLAEVEWFTGADLAALIHEASIVALKQRINDNDTTVNCVTREHFLVALKTVKPSVPENDRKTYLDLKERYGRK